MTMIPLKFKKLSPNAVSPQYAHLGEDACFDLTAVSIEHKDGKIIAKFGLAFEIPTGYVGLLFPRSSIHKQKCSLSNSVGVIDSGYRGEVAAVFYDLSEGNESISYKVGERCAQMMILPIPVIDLQEVDSLAESARGSGGFGSTGKQ